MTYERIGGLQLAQGDITGAVQSYHDSLTIRDRLAQSDSNNAGWQHDLAATCAKLAVVYRRANNVENALAALRQAKAIMIQLLKLLPNNADWKRELAWLNDQIAGLMK